MKISRHDIVPGAASAAPRTSLVVSSIPAASASPSPARSGHGVASAESPASACPPAAGSCGL